jgi:glycosyltransferase involved in cell wall biosynthesis
MPDLSIIIATYNRRRTVECILRALEGQSLPGGQFEVLVVDDGSTDGTVDMLNAYDGPLDMHTFSTGLPAGEYGYQLWHTWAGAGRCDPEGIPLDPQLAEPLYED